MGVQLKTDNKHLVNTARHIIK